MRLLFIVIMKHYYLSLSPKTIIEDYCCPVKLKMNIRNHP
ncbi:hypothetical protein HMPREF6485_1953 [Segatella buccae ATCC 33574]|uniref:Uncharacterized protein n=1 Tax=Segatella buccae ATCC 33574 TaxID=873513 RepID=E6K8L6_9BACT|nr:hypothetical protein HMPREF6485_1953 [Segatella buccae ATCC 33574]